MFGGGRLKVAGNTPRGSISHGLAVISADEQQGFS